MLAAAAAAALKLLAIDSSGYVPFEPKDSRATVVVFVSTVCPVSGDYAERLSKLYSDFKDQGVRFYYVYSNKTESPDSIREHVRGLGLPFPAFRDEANRLADHLDAQLTPAAYVLSAKGHMLYSGAIDDAVNPARVKTPYLRFAIGAALADQVPAVKSRPVYG
jgi:hypothetical protein